MKQFNGYNEARVMTDYTSLPRGGYVCQIKGVRDEGKGFFKIAVEITEGEYKGYFQQKFDSNTNEDKKWPGVYQLWIPKDDGSPLDSTTKNVFRTFTNAIEESNSGYHWDWDESKWKGKMVGIVFNYREYEYEGEVRTTLNGARATSVNNIREGKYKVPKDRTLKNRPSAPASTDGLNDFVNVTAAEEEELPF